MTGIHQNRTQRSGRAPPSWSMCLFLCLCLCLFLFSTVTLVDGFAAKASVSAPATITTKSGLQYIDLVPGDGRAPAKNDFISVHYEGKIQKTGKVFGATRGKTDARADLYKDTPYSFKLGRKTATPGFEEGIASMKVGGKRRLTIPANLAYGADGSPDGVIPKSADLVFDVELVSVDGNMSAAGALGKGFQIAIGLIVVNALTAVVTGHELREYINGSLN